MMRVLLLDNYDSFTWNLHHLLEPHASVDVVRNDAITVNDAAGYDRIVLSPGPGLPGDAGIMMELLWKLMPSKPILGVCLGMQGMVEICGGSLYNQPKVMHGVAVDLAVTTPTDPLFEGLPSHFKVGLYHSWAADPATMPPSLQIIARSEHGVIMGVRHKTFAVCGVQFHPESVLTPAGGTILANWIRFA